MKSQNFKFSDASTRVYFDGRFSQVAKLLDQKNAIIITDDNVFNAHGTKFRNWNTIVLKPGEQFKVQATMDAVIDQLIEMQADRQTTLIGVGGGVVTDITGYVASVFMRGISFGFVPTTLLAMVDAAIGGKNGIDVGVYKNMVGTIRQPGFILYDQSFLASLPAGEWRNGFAEIIKHACIQDAAMFNELHSGSVVKYQRNKTLLAQLVRKNVAIKLNVVKKDPLEKGERRLLNFGHTIGHALENQYELSHGEAISIGMTYAAAVSEELLGFRDATAVTALLEHYELPTLASFNLSKLMKVLKMDKKRVKKEINFIMLQRVGKAVVKPVALTQLEKIISSFQ